MYPIADPNGTSADLLQLDHSKSRRKEILTERALWNSHLKCVRTILSPLVAILLIAAVTGCATTQKYDVASAQFPQISSGQGRIYFYRVNQFYGCGMNEAIWLNDQKHHHLEVGYFFYLDVPARDYTVHAKAGLLEGKGQLPITLADGETKYIRIQQDGGVFGVNPVPILDDKDSALKILPTCIYNPNGK